MKNSEFIGENLKQARIYRKMTITELSEKINVSKQAISQYERGQNPESNNLLKLAAALNFPTEYFYTKTYDESHDDTVYFRSLLKNNKRDREAQSVKLTFIDILYQALKTEVNFRPLDIPSNIEFPKHPYEINDELSEIEEIAKSLRDHWGLGDQPIDNLQYEMEKHGILVMAADVNDHSIDAFSRNDIIMVSRKNQSYSRVLFDLAHEFGHYLLHPKTENLEILPHEEFKVYERQANAFASSFLLPKEAFTNDISKYKIDLNYYLHLKTTKWKVSVQAMVFRAHQLEILTFNQYQYLMKQISKKGWRKSEPGDSSYVIKGNLLKSAVLLLIERKNYTGYDFMTIFHNNGVWLEADEIEELLSLVPGTLEFPEKPTEDIIFIKH